jgi:hypothetical protein
MLLPEKAMHADPLCCVDSFLEQGTPVVEDELNLGVAKINH